MASMVLSDSMNKALKQTCVLLADLQGDWLVGGSCGLQLQDVSLAANPKDLDIYTDYKYVEQIASLLQKYAIDQPHYSETPIYHSYLSHYMIEGVQIELVGSFVVNSEGSSYKVQVSNLMKKHQVNTFIDHIYVGIMPLAHEFVFNILRGREDRYISISEKMRSQLGLCIPILREIIKKNQFSSTHINKMMDLLQYPLDERERL